MVPCTGSEANDLTVRIADAYAAKVASAEADGDAGAANIFLRHRDLGEGVGLAAFSAALTRRATLMRTWQLFRERCPLVLMPVSAELPFANDLDLDGPASFDRVWRAQTPQIAIPFLGLPALSVATAPIDGTPCGVQIVAGRYREDLCLEAGEVVAQANAPVVPVDPT